MTNYVNCTSVMRTKLSLKKILSLSYGKMYMLLVLRISKQFIISSIENKVFKYFTTAVLYKQIILQL